MPNQEAFGARIEYLHERVKDLRRQVSATPTAPKVLLDGAFEAIISTLAEMRVVEEEMRRQNDALAGSQNVAETWRHHYEDLFESAPDAYFVTDLAGVIREANQAASRLLGLSRNFLRGKPLATFIPDEQQRAFQQLLQGIPGAEAAIEQELRIRPHGAELREVGVTLSVVRNSQDGLLSLRWLVRDLTSRSQAEAERYRLLVQAVEDYAIMLLDTKGRVLNWNAGAEKILGYTEAEMRGKSLDVFFLPEDQQNGVPEQQLGRAQGKGRTEEGSWHRCKDGHLIWSNCVITALHDKDGRLRWFAKVLRDDTTRREKEEHLGNLYAREQQISATF